MTALGPARILTVVRQLGARVTTLWLLVWAGINTGPWVLESSSSSAMASVHLVRAFLPQLAFLGAGTIALASLSVQRFPTPFLCWLTYGVIAAVASVLSPDPWAALYWASAYLAPFAVLALVLRSDPTLDRLILLNQLTWLGTTLVLAGLVVASGETLSEGYGAYNRMPEVGGMAMSRSSGMARFAAVPGLVAFVTMLTHRGWRVVVATPVFCLSAALIYHLQSRGAILALATSMLVLIACAGRHVRAAAVVFGSITFVLWASDLIPVGFLAEIGDHLRRGQDSEHLASLTGRTRDWEAALIASARSPLLGFGPQADRLLIFIHVHNTYLYALLCAGVLGLLAFVAGLVSAWSSIWRLLARPSRPEGPFLEVIGLLAFFTVRSIPEVCGAIFGVDLLVMLPCIALVGAMDHANRKQVTARPDRAHRERVRLV
ncbi:MAG: O-antigen ligase family protein [Deltaproteobacteria bacterium]|nr:O-antigen ligase family protein [Deltaproteobacteria bacterium]